MTASFNAPDIVTCETRYVVALAGDYTMETRDQIPLLWQRLWMHDFEVDGLDMSQAFGVSFSVTQDGFRYGAGFEVGQPAVTPKGGCVITLSGGTYARFTERLPVAEIPALFDWIFSTWLTTSGRTQREGAVFELYPNDPGATQDARSIEVWVPIQASTGEGEAA